MTQVNAAAIAALAQLLGPMLANGGKSRKTRSDKGFTKQAVAEAQSVDEKRALLDAATVVAFEKAGFGKVTPRVDVLTYGKEKADGTKTGWLAKGRKVKAGQKSVHVKARGMAGKGIPLFHVSQTEELPVAEATETPAAQ